VENKSQLRKMEELDAKIGKISYDLISLENRKKELENKRIDIQNEIDKLEKEKSSILGKTDSMKPFQKLIYIMLYVRTDLKKVELLNIKLDEYQKEKQSIENKIDIQNGLYAETIKEKEQCIEKRKELYIDKNVVKENKNVLEKTEQVKSLKEISEIAKRFKEDKKMDNLRKAVEKLIKEYININENNKVENQEEAEGIE